MALITKFAVILGLLMIGAMIASFVKFNCIIAIPAGNGNPVQVQTYLEPSSRASSPSCTSWAASSCCARTSTLPGSSLAPW